MAKSPKPIATPRKPPATTPEMEAFIRGGGVQGGTGTLPAAQHASASGIQPVSMPDVQAGSGPDIQHAGLPDTRSVSASADGAIDMSAAPDASMPAARLAEPLAASPSSQPSDRHAEPPALQTAGTSPAPSAGSPARLAGPGIVTRKRGERVRRRLMVYLDPDVARRLEHQAIDEGRNLSDVVNEAVARYLAR